MSDSDRGGNPIQLAVVVLLLVGGGWYFLHHYRIDGLDEISIFPKGESSAVEQTYISYRDVPPSTVMDETFAATQIRDGSVAGSDMPPSNTVPVQTSAAPIIREYKHLRIASWAMDGFGPTKLANATGLRYFASVARQFDILALQQVASMERDLIPRMVDAINQGQDRYDYVIGKPVGPTDRPEQLAFIFDTTRVRVDRRHTYTLSDPQNTFAFPPLVAWFRAAAPPENQAWTFSLVNVRIDLARAPQEVAQLPNAMESVRADGRNEDDVILAGLMQADDAYLLPTLGGHQSFTAAVRSLPTDIFGRYQTSNLLIDTVATTEFLGRGGAYDFLHSLNLNLTQAETVTAQLPVYAEFAAVEGGL